MRRSHSHSIMLDIETLATSPNSVILTAGAVKFDPHSTAMPHHELYLKPDVDQQVALGRNVDNDTIEWWSKQPVKIQEEAFDSNGRIDLTEFAQTFNKYCVGADQIWYHGATFDMVIIENLFEQLKMGRNWNFWQLRDSRTLFDVMPHDPRKDFDQSNLHNSLEDARVQARAVQRVFDYLAR